MQLDDGDALDDPDTQSRVAELFLGVWAGEIENDSLNRLVVRAGLGVRDVVLLRALVKYLRQAGVRFTEAYIADALVTSPRAARLLCELFHAGSPSEPAARRGVEADRGRARRGEIDAVVGLDDDRMLRALLALVQAAVRTNAFAPGARRRWRSSSIRSSCRSSPHRGRRTRSGCTRRASKVCTCAPATSRAVASAGPIDARTSAPRSSGS